jgi:hypothetical protein
MSHQGTGSRWRRPPGPSAAGCSHSCHAGWVCGARGEAGTFWRWRRGERPSGPQLLPARPACHCVAGQARAVPCRASGRLARERWGRHPRPRPHHHPPLQLVQEVRLPPRLRLVVTAVAVLVPPRRRRLRLGVAPGAGRRALLLLLLLLPLLLLLLRLLRLLSLPLGGRLGLGLLLLGLVPLSLGVRLRLLIWVVWGGVR